MTQSEIRSMILNIVQGNLRWCDPTDRINLRKAEQLGVDYITTQTAEEVLEDIILDLTSLQDEIRIESSFQSANI
ncbi:MAG: hypothetical protein EBY39_05985 [Flavobacteriia bacterium]|nr:hypothetical protein [Flavobacteriia bacterium]